MAFDRPDRVSDLYHAALERAPEERMAFLREACKGDEVQRKEVESLLEYESARFLETPAVIDASIPTSMVNRQIGSYGQRFLMPIPGPPAPIVVLLNWPARLAH